jgi:NADPH:quinone reductase-like Zn-dependent oxidoreductase
MKAIVYHEYGSPDVLRLQEVDQPVPGDGEVLVKAHASSVNDYDWHLLTGRPLLNRIGGPFKPKYDVLGSDVAGRVEAVGRAVTRFRPGDEVFGDVSPCGFGGFAEYVCAPVSAWAPKPAGLTMEAAAAVPQAGGLAMTGLRGSPLRSGQRVLVNGAGGGVGSYAVQIAKSFGAEVTGVDRAAKLDSVRRLGADHVIDYAEQDFCSNGQTYDLILDVASHRSMAAYRRSLRAGGRCAIIGGSIPRLLLVMAVGPVVSSVRNRRVTVPLWKPNDAQEVAFLTGLLESGAVTPLVDSVFSLSEVPAAFRHFGAQRHIGKIVITI